MAIRNFPLSRVRKLYDRAKGLTWLGLGLRLPGSFILGFYFSRCQRVLNPPTCGSWIREQAQGSEILFFDSKFSGAFLLVLRVWLEAWAAWAGRVVVQEI